MIVSKKAPCKQLALLSLGVAWSICMIAIGYFLCKLNSSPWNACCCSVSFNIYRMLVFARSPMDISVHQSTDNKNTALESFAPRNIRQTNDNHRGSWKASRNSFPSKHPQNANHHGIYSAFEVEWIRWDMYEPYQVDLMGNGELFSDLIRNSKLGRIPSL